MYVVSSCVCVRVCVVSYTMDTLYFNELPSPVDIAEDLQMPQFSLVTSKVTDCSENYTSGFHPSIYIHIRHVWTLDIAINCSEAIIMYTRV